MRVGSSSHRLPPRCKLKPNCGVVITVLLLNCVEIGNKEFLFALLSKFLILRQPLYALASPTKEEGFKAKYLI